MAIQFCRPSNSLTPFVKYYWGMDICLAEGQTHTQQLVPTGLTDLSIYLNGRPKAISNDSDLSANILFSGQQKLPHEIVVKSRMTVFSVCFAPLGARMLLGFPPSEISGMTVPFDYLKKNMALKLEEELAQADNFLLQVRVMEKYLMGELLPSLENQKNKNFLRIGDSIDAINRVAGIVGIGDLANKVNLGRKQFERVFIEQIGITPKKFIRVVRFQNAIKKAQVSRQLNLTDIAYDCGYFDQSHMIADFKSLSGMTPKQYLKDQSPVSDYFL